MFNLKPEKNKTYDDEIFDRVDILAGELVDVSGRTKVIRIKIYTYNINE